jgi:trehalose 6-phosphate phosphatase
MTEADAMEPAEESWALFLDFDGTLVDIVERPDAVVVDPALQSVLSRLQERLGGAVAVISGRPVAFLDEKLAPLHLDTAGLHGIEHRIGGRFSPCDPDDHPRLRVAVGELRHRIAGRDGLLIEDKGCSVALHWRMVPNEAEFARETALALAEGLGDGYKIQFGKAVAEILPSASGKGRIITAFMEEAPYRGRRPVFIGDDLTDEHGFEAVNALGGVSIRIGEGDTVAARRLATPSELRRCLAKWAEHGAGQALKETADLRSRAM